MRGYLILEKNEVPVIHDLYLTSSHATVSTKWASNEVIGLYDAPDSLKISWTYVDICNFLVFAVNSRGISGNRYKMDCFTKGVFPVSWGGERH